MREADPARIAAQVVSGVGFLSAGAIFRNKNVVKGLTTASIFSRYCQSLLIPSAG